MCCCHLLVLQTSFLGGISTDCKTSLESTIFVSTSVASLLGLFRPGMLSRFTLCESFNTILQDTASVCAHIKVRRATWKFIWWEEIGTPVLAVYHVPLLCLKNLKTRCLLMQNVNILADDTSSTFLGERNTPPVKTLSQKYTPFYPPFFPLWSTLIVWVWKVHKNSWNFSTWLSRISSLMSFKFAVQITSL